MDERGGKPPSLTLFQLYGRWYRIMPVASSADASTTRRAGRASARKVAVGLLSIGDKRFAIVPEEEPRSAGDGLFHSRLVELLTERELQVAALVATGLINKQIADKLEISEWTVSSHLRRIFSKLGVDTRAAMIFRCVHLSHPSKE